MAKSKRKGKSRSTTYTKQSSSTTSYTGDTPKTVPYNYRKTIALVNSLTKAQPQRKTYVQHATAQKIQSATARHHIRKAKAILALSPPLPRSRTGTAIRNAYNPSFTGAVKAGLRKNCKQRKEERREVLFAKDIAGKSGSAPGKNGKYRRQCK